MRILLMTQYYPPEIGAAQNRLSYLVRYLATSGHTVTVVTALPNYPTGKMFDEYRGRLMLEERENDVRIIRTWIYVTEKRSFLRRMLNYCSFAVISLFTAALKVGPQEVVIVESPPPFLGLSGFLIGWLKRARFALNVSDLWPESAVALGVLQNRLLIGLATRLEEFLYRKAHLITGQTEGIVTSIESRCRDKSVALIPNGVEVERFAPEAQGNGKRECMKTALGFDGNFVVGYTGLMGLVHGLETVLCAAQVLSECPDILFAFIGDGPEKAKLVAMSQRAGLQNVRFLPLKPASQIPQILAAVDVALVPVKRHPLFKGTLSAKMFEAMGAGIAVVASIDGEARVLLEKSQGGICVEPENANQMAEAILKLYRDPALKKALGEHGRRYVTKHYNRAEAAKKFEQLLLTIAHASLTPVPLAEAGV